MAKLTNFIFKIKSVASIKLIILNKPMGLITFYIISINILFLLCLTDINKFGAYFKNITNQII